MFIHLGFLFLANLNSGYQLFLAFFMVPISSSLSFSSGILSSLASFHFLLAGFHLFLEDFFSPSIAFYFCSRLFLPGCHFV
jgi:hypothetical protein